MLIACFEWRAIIVRGTNTSPYRVAGAEPYIILSSTVHEQPTELGCIFLPPIFLLLHLSVSLSSPSSFALLSLCISFLFLSPPFPHLPFLLHFFPTIPSSLSLSHFFPFPFSVVLLTVLSISADSVSDHTTQLH